MVAGAWSEAHTPSAVRTWKLPTMIDSVSFNFLSSVWVGSVTVSEERKPRPGDQKGQDSILSPPGSTGSYWEGQLLSFHGFYNCLTWTLLKLTSIKWWVKIILKIKETWIHKSSFPNVVTDTYALGLLMFLLCIQTYVMCIIIVQVFPTPHSLSW